MRKDKLSAAKTFANPEAEAPALLPQVPVAVLTSPRTAASAEVIAAALQDHHRALIIGQRTSGRTVIFSLVPVPGGAVQVPVAELCRADGTPIERGPGMTDAGRWGVIPDIAIPEAPVRVPAVQFRQSMDNPILKTVETPPPFHNTHPLYEPEPGAKPVPPPPAEPLPAAAARFQPAALKSALQYLHEQLARK